MAKRWDTDKTARLQDRAPAVPGRGVRHDRGKAGRKVRRIEADHPAGLRRHPE
jgi:hypothetical protein